MILGRHEFPGEYDRRGNKRYIEKETDVKETDVNVVVHLLQGAYEDRYDTAVVMTGDTDMVPAMKLVRMLNKRVVWCHFPEHAGHRDLAKVSDERFLLTEQFLRPLKYLVVRRM